MASSHSDVIDRYRRLKSDFDVSAERLKEALTQLVLEMGLHATVDARAKEVASFGRKIFVKSYEDPWAQVTDKVGGRIVLAVSTDVDRVSHVVAAFLDSAKIEDKRVLEDPERLQYSGVHVTGIMPGMTIDGEPVRVEVQVRTIVQDAWSVVSHSLVYKPMIRLSVESQRRVIRLVALAEIFDEEVSRAMNDLASQPGYEVVPILDVAESVATSVGIFNGNRDWSVEILLAIQSCLPADDPTDYRARLESFVREYADRIRHVVTTYGPESDLAGHTIGLLVSQPESLVIMERLAAAPLALEDAWGRADLPDDLLDPLRQVVA